MITTFALKQFQAKIAARRYARCLDKLGFRVRFHNFRVVNVLGTCSMPWAIKIVNFSEKYREAASYEPELHPGVTYKLRYPKATLKIFSTGSITVTGKCNESHFHHHPQQLFIKQILMYLQLPVLPMFKQPLNIFSRLSMNFVRNVRLKN